MANTNAPYGFRLWSRLVPGTGAAMAAPGFYPTIAKSDIWGAKGPLQFPSAASLKVGDPIKNSLGVGYIATGTNGIYGILNSPVPAPFGETATQKHYPDILPADDQTIWRVQSIGTVNVTQGLLGFSPASAKKYRIGGTTSGYTGIDLSHSTGGCLVIVGMPPDTAFGTYAELLVMVAKGPFFGQAS